MSANEVESQLPQGDDGPTTLSAGGILLVEAPMKIIAEARSDELYCESLWRPLFAAKMHGADVLKSLDNIPASGNGT